jgi:hypothetical protein
MSAPVRSFTEFLRTNWVVIALRIVLEPMLAALMNLSATRREFIWWHMILTNVIIFVAGVASSLFAGKHKKAMVGLPIIRNII